MNWDEKAEEATTYRGYESTGEAWGFVEGAQWVLHELRTDEAIERVAQAIGEWEPEDWDNPEFREDRAFWTDKARTAINALLGEDQ